MFKKVRIIAEVGVNHNGKVTIAKKLVDHAKLAGADYVKFQTFYAESLVTKKAQLVKYQKNTKFSTQYSLLKSLELNRKNFKELFSYCKKKKINFLSTAFDLESALYLKKLGQKIFKIPSGEIDNYPLLELISKIASKVFLSTGMSNLKEIKNAINILVKNKLKKKDIIVLHCTTQYPTEKKNVNLLAMKSIRQKLNISVGYSDHTMGTLVSALAVSLGAELIEKHITLDNKMIGPDHKASMKVDDFYKFVEEIKSVKEILGKTEKKPTVSEKKILKKIRKSIYAKNNILKGDLFNLDNLITKRPQTGLSPIFWKKILGKKSKKNYYKDDLIKL